MQLSMCEDDDDIVVVTLIVKVLVMTLVVMVVRMAVVTMDGGFCMRQVSTVMVALRPHLMVSHCH